MNTRVVYAPRPKRRHNVAPDFFARRVHFIDHLADIWLALPADKRGKFYVPQQLVNHAAKRGIIATPLVTKSNNPLSCEPPQSSIPMVMCAYGDMQIAKRAPFRPLILMEHGVGLTFNRRSGDTYMGYAGGCGARAHVSLFLSPNFYIAQKTLVTFPTARQVIVGTPKMDKWLDAPKPQNKRPVLVVSFHWDGASLEPEAGNAWRYYKDMLSTVAQNYTLFGHGHPKIIEQLKGDYRRLGIPVMEDFEEVLARADLYINDASSTMYEFAVTDRPVVVLNCPAFRRNINHGIRFWDYSDVGINCNGSGDLLDAIKEALVDPEHIQQSRRHAVRDLYPHLGLSAHIAAEAIMSYCYE